MRSTPQELQCSQEYLDQISTLIMLFEEKDRLLSFQFIFNYNQFNTKDLQGYLINNYDIILTTLSSSGLSAFDSDYVNRQLGLRTLFILVSPRWSLMKLARLQRYRRWFLCCSTLRSAFWLVIQNNFQLRFWAKTHRTTIIFLCLNDSPTTITTPICWTCNIGGGGIAHLMCRCHPKIAAFPNLCFYEGKLLNGENVQGERYSHQFYETDFFHVRGSDDASSTARRFLQPLRRFHYGEEGRHL